MLGAIFYKLAAYPGLLFLFTILPLVLLSTMIRKMRRQYEEDSDWDELVLLPPLKA